MTPAEVLAEWRTSRSSSSLRDRWPERLAAALEETLELLDVFVGEHARAYYQTGGRVTVHVADDDWRRAYAARGGFGRGKQTRDAAPPAVPRTQIGPDDPWPEGLF